MFNVSSFLLGFGCGSVTGFFAREIAQAGQGVIAPLVKSLIKSGITTAEKARESVAYIGESFEDLLAEARAEMKAPKKKIAKVKTPAVAKKRARQGAVAAAAEAEANV